MEVQAEGCMHFEVGCLLWIFPPSFKIVKRK